MTTPHRADLISRLQISGVTDAALDGFARDAVDRQASELRADGVARSADRTTEAVRAAVRETVARRLRSAEMRADGYTVPRNREIEICEAMCEGLGLRADSSGAITSMRADAQYFTEELSARSDVLIRPNLQPDMVRMTVPTRNVPAYAEYFDKDFLEESGEAALLTPGQTQGFNRVNHRRTRHKGRMHWIGIATHSSWDDAFYSQAPTGVDSMAEDARIARERIEKKWEELLIKGLAGADFDGLATLSIPRILSSVNFASATIGAKGTELVRLLQRIRTAADFVGSAPSVGLIDPGLGQLIRNSNNMDSGGSATGRNLMEMMAAEGLQSVIEAPSLHRWWSSPRGSNYAQMVVWNPGTRGRLEQVVGLTPAPVSTAEHHGTETLYAAKLGGLDAGDLSSIAIIDIQISGS